MGRRNQVRNSLPHSGQKWLIALYIRLSKEDGNDVSNSIIHQEERLNAYLSNFDDDHEFVGTYKEMKIPKVIQFEYANPPRKARNKGF